MTRHNTLSLNRGDLIKINADTFFYADSIDDFTIDLISRYSCIMFLGYDNKGMIRILCDQKIGVISAHSIT